MMALSPILLEENLKCSICLKIFKDPVILTCSHSFCRTCIERTWHQKEMKECQICGKKAKRKLINNLVLKEACESFLKEKKCRMESQSVVCLLHTKKPPFLFCVDDQQLVCPQCVDQDHQNHKFCSISKAAEKQKSELEKPLQALHAKSETLESKLSTYLDMFVKFQSQVQQTEEMLKEEFEKLHQFLRKEEEARIITLREEEEEKSKKMKAKISEMNKMLTSVSEQISQVKDDMSSDDSLFLHNFKNTEERVKHTVPDPELGHGAQIDVAKHLGNLRYYVWEKMKDICPYYPIILDQATIRSKLQLSPDLNSVTFGLGQSTTISPSKYAEVPFILGSEGFTSGSHTWQVEVGPSDQWAVGVIKESAKTKSNPFNFALSVYMLNGKCSWNPQPAKINKVCVFLDSEKKQVTFTDPDSNTILKTCTYPVPEKMYPCFCTFSKFPISIIPAKVSVSL